MIDHHKMDILLRRMERAAEEIEKMIPDFTWEYAYTVKEKVKRSGKLVGETYPETKKV